MDEFFRPYRELIPRELTEFDQLIEEFKRSEPQHSVGSEHLDNTTMRPTLSNRDRKENENWSHDPDEEWMLEKFGGNK